METEVFDHWMDKLEDQLIGINDQLSTLNELLDLLLQRVPDE